MKVGKASNAAVLVPAWHSTWCHIPETCILTRTVVRNIPQRKTPHYRGADKSLARPGRKQATATEDFDVHISYLLS